MQGVQKSGADMADDREEIASQTLASHVQPFCNIQHIAKIYLVYYQRYTF